MQMTPRLKVYGQSTRQPRQIAATTPVIAPAWAVLGGTGRVRFVVVYRCPGERCGATHVAHLRGDLPSRAERPLPCGAGRVVLLPVLKAAAA